MQLEDLTPEQQEHFKKVVEYCKENGLEEQLEEATHLDQRSLFESLTKFIGDVEYFYNTSDYSWTACTNSNLYQKPDKPWNFSQETKMKPEDLKCFKEVVDVIGHEGAVKELQVVIDTVDTKRLDADRVLSDTFYWHDTPQGWTFWRHIDGGKVPESYRYLNNEKKEPDSSDMVAKPSHYQLLPEYEVKDVMKALLDKIEASDFDMSYYEAGWYQQSMQYFLRFHGKNGLEDLEKGLQTMQFVVDSLKERNENK